MGIILFLYIIIVGHKNLGKVPMPHVVSMAEEPIIVPRRPHTRTVRPCQWHITRGGPVVEKSFGEGASPDMTAEMVAASTFNASHQTSCLHLCEKDP